MEATGSDAKDSDDLCLVCLQNFQSPVGRPESCTHVFCLSCIEEAARRKNECPLCRRRFRHIQVSEHIGRDIIKTIEIPRQLTTPNEIVGVIAYDLIGLSEELERLHSRLRGLHGNQIWLKIIMERSPIEFAQLPPSIKELEDLMAKILMEAGLEPRFTLPMHIRDGIITPDIHTSPSLSPNPLSLPSVFIQALQPAISLFPLLLCDEDQKRMQDITVNVMPTSRPEANVSSREYGRKEEGQWAVVKRQKRNNPWI
ncbi:unnamed protein product [Hymenolepis diminuta]|uniref:RING-type domain-containing protein n=1 Tax=Hymenolepis diminuta TaxID=6216 RepID=A0A564Z4S2_HYMDI|nr:unnamed protein product [Hymenolepis diminuta]